MARVLSFNSDHVKNQQDSSTNLQPLVDGRKELGATLDAVCESRESKWKATQDPESLDLGSLWTSTAVLAATTSFRDAAQQKLVDFVVQLQKRPTLEKDGQVCKVHDMTVWKDLPTFGWTIRNAWNFNATDSDEKSAQHWININAFVARLLANDPNDDLGLALFGIWTIRETLEEGRKAPDVALAAAATWFVFAGPMLWKYSSAGKTFDGKVAKPGSAFQDNEWRGYTQARWDAWQEKLNDAQGEVSNPTAVDLVQQAIEAIRACQ